MSTCACVSEIPQLLPQVVWLPFPAVTDLKHVLFTTSSKSAKSSAGPWQCSSNAAAWRRSCKRSWGRRASSGNIPGCSTNLQHNTLLSQADPYTCWPWLICSILRQGIMDRKPASCNAALQTYRLWVHVQHIRSRVCCSTQGHNTHGRT